MPLSQLKTHLLIDFDEIYFATGFARLFNFSHLTWALVRQWMLLRSHEKEKRLFFLSFILNLSFYSWFELIEKAWELLGKEEII